ncbi:MAG TPA: GNVR domain-containing protein [Desulfobacterales bacterium]|nr:GNVR domain-containing protein [Desulfobacterales bacterium]
MSITENAIKPEYILEILLRRRWFVIIPFCLSMIAGIYLALTLPKIYSAETLILIEAQRVPANYVQSIVSSDINERINTLSQQIMSRTNLEKVINQFNLYSDMENEKTHMENKLATIRKNISVNVSRDRQVANAFSIRFKGTDPEKVMNVANTLASYFIDENLKLREVQAVGTSDFLEEELNTMRKRLEEVEEALKEYRREYMGELPEQLQTNLSILQGLQNNLQSRQESLRDARNRMILLNNQRAVAQNLPLPGDSSQVGSGPLTPEQMEERLTDLRARYTDQHPDVVRLKKMIADFQAKNENISGNTTEASRNDTGTGGNLLSGSQREQSEIKREIRNLEAEISELTQQITYYKKRVENTPKREQELASLRRDYENINATYNSLLGRKLEAEIAVNMERKQKGERFRVIDIARLPVNPVEPNMKRLFMMVVAAGFGIGGGLIFLLEFLDTSFRKPEDIESFLGLPILAAVPELYNRKKEVRQRLDRILSLVAIMVGFILLAGFAVLSLKGVDRTMNFIRKFVDI